jgi:hypothetical protein
MRGSSVDQLTHVQGGPSFMARATRVLFVVFAMVSFFAAPAAAAVPLGGGASGPVVSDGDGADLDFFLDAGDSTTTKGKNFSASDFAISRSPSRRRRP